jgi:DNA-binding MarR family transcriptional regulator
MKPFSDSKKSISFRIFDTVRYLGKAIDHLMSVNNIPLAGDQIPLLMLSAQFEGSSMNDLAKIIERDKAGILRGLRSLEKRGLILFKDAAMDRRKRLVYLTSTGHELLEQIMKNIGESEKQIEKGMTVAERTTLCNVLDRIRVNCLKLTGKEGKALDDFDFGKGMDKNKRRPA